MFEPGDKVKYKGIRPYKSGRYTHWWVMPEDEGTVVEHVRGGHVTVRFSKYPNSVWSMYDGDLQLVEGLEEKR